MISIDINHQSRSKKKVCSRDIVTLLQIIYEDMEIADYSYLQDMSFMEIKDNNKNKFIYRMKINNYLQKNNASNLKEALGKQAYYNLVRECSKKELALKHLSENNVTLIQINECESFKRIKNFLLETLTNDKKSLEVISNSVI